MPDVLSGQTTTLERLEFSLSQSLQTAEDAQKQQFALLWAKIIMNRFVKDPDESTLELNGSQISKRSTERAGRRMDLKIVEPTVPICVGWGRYSGEMDYLSVVERRPLIAVIRGVKVERLFGDKAPDREYTVQQFRAVETANRSLALAPREVTGTEEVARVNGSQPISSEEERRGLDNFLAAMGRIADFHRFELPLPSQP